MTTLWSSSTSTPPTSSSSDDSLDLELALAKFDGSDSNGSSSTSSASESRLALNRKHTERRREGWRLSAQRKRAAQAGAFQEVGLALPLTKKVLRGLDKVAVLRVAVSYVKLRAVLNGLKTTNTDSQNRDKLPDFLDIDPEINALFQAGFAIVLASNGDIVYVSESVSKYMRGEQLALLGTNIYDHIQTTDHADVNRLLKRDLPIGTCKAARDSAFVRLNGGQKSGQALRITGKLIRPASTESADESPSFYFVGIAEPLDSPLDYVFPFPQFRVLVALDFVCMPDMRFVWDDELRAEAFVGYTASDLARISSGWQLIHPEDIQAMEDSFRQHFLPMDQHSRGQTPCYRMLCKNGGWAWFVSQASVVQVEMPTGGQDGSSESILFWIGRDFMISEIMQAGEIFASVQLGGGSCQEYELAKMEPDVQEFMDLIEDLDDAFDQSHSLLSII